LEWAVGWTAGIEWAGVDQSVKWWAVGWTAGIEWAGVAQSVKW